MNSHNGTKSFVFLSIGLALAGATFNISAANSSSTLSGGSVSHNSISDNYISGNIATPVIIRAANTAPLVTPQLAAYWAGWSGYQYDLQNTYSSIPLTTLYLAFANYVNGAIDTSVSGSYTNIPAENAQILPTYQNWTTYAYNNPKVKMVMSLGGASFSAMWRVLNNDQAAKDMAAAIIKALNTEYPVYAPAGNNPQIAFAINSPNPSPNTAYGNSHLLGYVQINGIDFDTEVSGAQEMAALTPYLVKVAAAVHQALPDKTISFATFSVGGDPNGACTVAGSAHCGEALPLINAIKDDSTLQNIVTYNVMAYDAGEDFVIPTQNNGGNPLYQQALQNYTAAVGNPAQVVLGLDLQRQWGVRFPETCAQLAAEAQWAYQNPMFTGGTFLWEIGDDSNNCQALPALQSMAAAMPS